jgi:polysaccharide export outer membrane protein
MRFPSLLLATAAMCLSGCAHEKFVGRPGLTIVQNADLPPPAQSDRILTGRPFVVGPLDRVTIDVYGVPELSRTVQVDSSGIISLPLVGNLAAAGKTPIQLADVVAVQLRRYVRDPQVTVNTETVNQMITVDGQVNEPGQYPVTGDLTLMRAIAQAKGAAQYADQNYVVVFRRVNNQQMAALYDLRAIRQGIYKDPPVFANDIVLVGEDNSRRLFQNVIQGAAILVGPLVAIVN